MDTKLKVNTEVENKPYGKGDNSFWGWILRYN